MQKEALYERNFECLFCKTKFPVWKLYPTVANKTIKYHDLFEFPYYMPCKNVPFINYLYLEVKVCPGCFFATNEDAFFYSDSGTVKMIIVSKETIANILSNKQERAAMIESNKTLFSKERTFDDAITSYKLAIATSNVLFTADKEKYKIEVVRMGNYGLRIYRLCEETKKLDQIKKWLEFSQSILSKVLEFELDSPVIYRGIYQLVALSIYLGNDKHASQAFEILKRDSQDKGTKEAVVYFNRVKKLWQDREYVRSTQPTTE